MEPDTRIKEVLAGDLDAYVEIVRAYEPMIRGFLAAHLQDSAEISELTQQTFIAAYRKLSTYRRDGNFGFWLKAIARNAMRMHFRSTARRSRAMSRFCEEIIDEVHYELAAMERQDAQVSAGQLRSCVDKLPPRMNDAVRGRYFREHTMSQVAEALNLNTNALSALLFRARRLLRQCMEAQAE